MFSARSDTAMVVAFQCLSQSATVRAASLGGAAGPQAFPHFLHFVAHRCGGRAVDTDAFTLAGHRIDLRGPALPAARPPRDRALAVVAALTHSGPPVNTVNTWATAAAGTPEASA